MAGADLDGAFPGELTGWFPHCKRPRTIPLHGKDPVTSAFRPGKSLASLQARVNTDRRLSPASPGQQTSVGTRPLSSDYMEDSQENPAKDFNKLDLSQLQGFSFGTQWTQDKSSPSESRERSDRPRRDYGSERRDGPGGAPDRRDRRGFRKAASAPGEGVDAPAGPGPAASDAPPRREYSGERGERGPRRDFRGPRRDGPGGYGPRGDQPPLERGPYESPYFSVAFYPEDTSFNALAKTIRSSCRTIELFEIARTVIGKNDRFVVVLARRVPGAGGPGGRPGAVPAAAPEPAAASAAKQPIYLSVPDGVPFDTEEAAIAHVLSNHLTRFFDLAEVEIEPPKGNFLVINKCGVTGELLGPPNYHRYNQIVQQHYSAKIARMPFDVFRSRIETVRDPAVVAQWLEKMKKTTRYTWKSAAKPVTTPPVVAAEPATPATVEGVAEVAVQNDSTTPETAPAITFDNFEDARGYLLQQVREKVVRPVETARFHGKLLEKMPPGEIRRAIEGALERQRRFPLDTANALRGRLRREHFTIFKKGSKGVSYVCAVKRKFRVPGQTFAETISALITFLEAHPMIRASELSAKFLGIDVPVAAKPAEAAPAPAPTEGAAPVEAVAPAPAAPAEPLLTIDQRARISRMQGDLRWLVTEGYVTEFIDGRLFAPPPMVEARKKEVEAEEHDPENFPEAPSSAAPFETATAAAAPVEAVPAPTEAAPVEPSAPAADAAAMPAETASEATPALPLTEPSVEPAPAPATEQAAESVPPVAPAN